MPYHRPLLLGIGLCWAASSGCSGPGEVPRPAQLVVAAVERPAPPPAVVVPADRSPESIAALRRSLDNPAAEVRLAAATALGDMGRPAVEAATDLLRAQEDSDPRVRDAATRALLRLIELDGPPAVRMRALR